MLLNKKNTVFTCVKLVLLKVNARPTAKLTFCFFPLLRDFFNIFYSEAFGRIKLSSVRSHGTLAMIMINLAKSWLTMVPFSRSWLIMMERLPKSWQDLGKITMVCHGRCQGYHVKDTIEPFSVIARVLVEI